MLSSLLTGARLLCLSPHPDDTEFGLGATLHRLRDDISAHVIVFTDRHESRGETRNEEEQRRAAEILGIPAANVHFLDELGYGVGRLPIRFMASQESRDTIRRVVARLVQDFAPNVVFVPGLNETHQDHMALAEEVVRVARGEYAILGYEVPKHNRAFRPNAFLPVDDADLTAKIAAINAFTEFTNRYYFADEGIRALARVRGLDAGGGGMVEAFEVYRLMLG